jgi:hypothetical protein
MSNLNFLHSGGNKVTLSAPDSNPSSDVTLKLPQADGSADQFLKTDGSGALSFATPTNTLGLAMADSWRVTADITNFTNADITSNWARNFTTAMSGGYDHAGAIGSAMTESSGIFSFPSTGVYLIKFFITTNTNNTSNRYLEANIMVTRDNFSSSQMFSRGFGNSYNSTSSTYFTAVAEAMFDVKNSNHKVKFNSSAGNAVTVIGGNYNLTYASFIRLGDT